MSINQGLEFRTAQSLTTPAASGDPSSSRRGAATFPSLQKEGWRESAGVVAAQANKLIVSLCIGLLLLTGNAFADGKLSHLSGAVTVQKADGSKVAATPGAEVKQGDTVLTGVNGFARMETTDGGEIVLRPNSEFKIEKYNYDKAKPEEDSFVYNMVKGGLRTVTGLIGKRGNKDAYLGKTPTSTIGIRGTFFEVRVCGECGSLPKGTYFSVRSGSISTGNSFGDITMTAGQIVFVPPNGAPQVLLRDPGIGFTPPADIPKLEDKKPDGGGEDDGAPPAGEAGDGEVNCSIQ
ncbi:MAG: FecR domain-containing protein [Methylophilaceae bacterium]